MRKEGLCVGGNSGPLLGRTPRGRKKGDRVESEEEIGRNFSTSKSFEFGPRQKRDSREVSHYVCWGNSKVNGRKTSSKS